MEEGLVWRGKQDCMMTNSILISNIMKGPTNHNTKFTVLIIIVTTMVRIMDIKMKGVCFFKNFNTGLKMMRLSSYLKL